MSNRLMPRANDRPNIACLLSRHAYSVNPHVYGQSLRHDIGCLVDRELINRWNIGVGSSNNYAYLVKDDKSNDAVIIDPAHPEE